MNSEWKNGQFKLHRQYALQWDNFDLSLAFKDYTGHITVFGPAVLHAGGEGKGPWISAACFENGMPGSRNLLQAVMDAAWEEGIRPTGWEGHELQLGALKSHLQDMRQIVAKKIGVELP